MENICHNNYYLSIFAIIVLKRYHYFPSIPYPQKQPNPSHLFHLIVPKTKIKKHINKILLTTPAHK